jgi:hypothetical protein
MAPWLIIMYSGLDGRISWHLLLQPLLITITYKNSQKSSAEDSPHSRSFFSCNCLLFYGGWLGSDLRLPTPVRMIPALRIDYLCSQDGSIENTWAQHGPRKTSFLCSCIFGRLFVGMCLPSRCLATLRQNIIINHSPYFGGKVQITYLLIIKFWALINIVCVCMCVYVCVW